MARCKMVNDAPRNAGSNPTVPKIKQKVGKMKIITRGVPPKDALWRGECDVCGSIAEALGSEMTNIKYDRMYNESLSWEKCPVCGASIENGNGGMLFRYQKIKNSTKKMKNF